jgi:hypothetical protein
MRLTQSSAVMMMGSSGQLVWVRTFLGLEWRERAQFLGYAQQRVINDFVNETGAAAEPPRTRRRSGGRSRCLNNISTLAVGILWASFKGIGTSLSLP